MCDCRANLRHHCVQFRLDRSTDDYISPISRSINAYSLGYEATGFCVHYAMPTDGSWVCQITGELLPQQEFNEVRPSYGGDNGEEKVGQMAFE